MSRTLSAFLLATSFPRLSMISAVKSRLGCQRRTVALSASSVCLLAEWQRSTRMATALRSRRQACFRPVFQRMNCDCWLHATMSALNSGVFRWSIFRQWTGTIRRNSSTAMKPNLRFVSTMIPKSDIMLMLEKKWTQIPAVVSGCRRGRLLKLFR